MNTIKSHFKTKVFKDYLLDCIDSEPYGIVWHTNEQKLRFLYDTLISEYGHEVKRHGLADACGTWAQGLPSSFNVDFLNYKILEIAPLLGMNLNTEKKRDAFLASWFDRVGKHTAALMVANNKKMGL